MSPCQPHRLKFKGGGGGLGGEQRPKMKQLLLVFPRSWRGCDACKSILAQYFPQEVKREKTGWLAVNRGQQVQASGFLQFTTAAKKKKRKEKKHLVAKARGDEGTRVGFTQLSVVQRRASRGHCGTASAQSSLPSPPLSFRSHTYVHSPTTLVLKCICCLEPPSPQIFDFRLDPTTNTFAEKEKSTKEECEDMKDTSDEATRDDTSSRARGGPIRVIPYVQGTWPLCGAHSFAQRPQ